MVAVNQTKQERPTQSTQSTRRDQQHQRRVPCTPENASHQIKPVPLKLHHALPFRLNVRCNPPANRVLNPLFKP